MRSGRITVPAGSGALVVALALVGCASGGSSSAGRETGAAVQMKETTTLRRGPSTAGADSGPPELPAPPPDRSTTAFVDGDYRYVMRLEMKRLRETPLEPEARKMMEAIRYWQDIIEGAGLDPIGQIDRLVVGSPERRSSGFLVLARHHAPSEQVVATVEALAEAQEAEPAWREVDGLQVARWPMRDERPRSIVILDEHWVAIAPNEQVRRVVAVASRGEGAEIVPGTAMPWSEQDPLVPEGAGLHAVGREGVRDERPEHYPVRFDLEVHVREDGGVECEWRGVYRDGEEAKAAHRHWEARRKKYAGNIMINLLDLDRPIDQARWSRKGKTLTFALDLTLEEMALLIRFATPTLTGG